MPAEVIIESAGDHVFDLGHLRREGGEELVSLLLQNAGYDESLWRLRVEKKVTCSSETRPVAVVGHKPWCCYVKIKPGDNNSGHYCSLLMPDGLRGEEVFEALKHAEDSIDRNWRNERKDRLVPVGASSTPALSPLEPMTPIASTTEMNAHSGAAAELPFSDDDQDDTSQDAHAAAGGRTELRNWTKDPDKLRSTLVALREVDRSGPWSSKTAFVTALARKLGWEGVNRHEMGGVFTSLVRTDYIVPVRRGSKDLGYTLSAKGNEFIKDVVAQEEAQAAAAAAPAPVEPPPPPVPTIDAAQLMLDFTPLAQQLAEASRRLQENRSRRSELAAEIELLDAEADEISHVFKDHEVQVLVQRLLSQRQRAAN